MSHLLLIFFLDAIISRLTSIIDTPSCKKSSEWGHGSHRRDLSSRWRRLTLRSLARYHHWRRRTRGTARRTLGSIFIQMRSLCSSVFQLVVEQRIAASATHDGPPVDNIFPHSVNVYSQCRQYTPCPGIDLQASIGYNADDDLHTNL